MKLSFSIRSDRQEIILTPEHENDEEVLKALAEFKNPIIKLSKGVVFESQEVRDLKDMSEEDKRESLFIVLEQGEEEVHDTDYSASSVSGVVDMLRNLNAAHTLSEGVVFPTKPFIPTT